MFNFFNEIIADYGLDSSLFNNFNIINMSNKLVYIEGHKGVVSISKQNISIRVKKGVLLINGNNLQIKRITSSTVTVIGNIKEIESY
mgnify:CR=1 FL=1